MAEQLNWAAAERYRDRRGLGFYCPACRQKWFHPQGLRNHMAKLHHMCRFCPKAYIRVERHEKLAHTNEYARSAGAPARAVPVAEPCVLCGKPGRRFNLNVRIGQTTRGAGRTHLCEACWRRLIEGSPRRGGSPEL